MAKKKVKDKQRQKAKKRQQVKQREEVNFTRGMNILSAQSMMNGQWRHIDHVEPEGIHDTGSFELEEDDTKTVEQVENTLKLDDFDQVVRFAEYLDEQGEIDKSPEMMKQLYDAWSKGEFNDLSNQ